MTNKQAKICKAVRKYKTLGRVLQKSGVADYIELQECLGPGMLEFSDFDMTEDTVVTLCDQLMEELEDRGRASFQNVFTWVLSICAIIISIIALFRS